MTTRSGSDLAPTLVAAALLVLAGVHAVDMAFLCDDAFISFRYASNLAEGRGLVFNPGERVEGYTNFLLVVVLAAVQAVSGVPPEIVALPLGLGVAAVCSCCVAWMASRSPVGGTGAALVCAAALYAGNRSLAVWATSGLETRLFTLWVVAGLAVAHGSAGRARWLAGASVCFGLAVLTRPEALLFGPIALVWAAGPRPFEPSRVLAAGGPFLAVVLAHLAFRLGYYGSWLPNTFAAKGGEVWPEAGVRYLLTAALEHGLVIVGPLAVVGAVARWRSGDTLYLLTAALLVPHLLFLVRIGGDHFEFRMLDLVFVLGILAASDGIAALAHAVPRGRLAVGAALLGLALLAQGAVPWLDRRTTHHLSGRMYAEHHAISANGTPLEWVAGMGHLVDAWNAQRAWSAPRLVATRQVEHRNFWRRQVEWFGPYRTVREHVPAGLVTVEGAVGILPYHLPDVVVVDAFGLTDAVVAHAPARPLRPTETRRLAHIRRDVRTYFDDRRTVTIRRACATAGEALGLAPWAAELGPGVWMPFDGDPAQFDGLLVVGGRLERPGDLVHTPSDVWEVVRTIDDLERLDSAWSVGGTAFDGTPARDARPGQGPVSGVQGRGFANSFHQTRGDAATGRLSRTVVLEPGERLALALAGGSGPDVGARLTGPSGTHVLRGDDTETLRARVFDDVGSGEAVLELFDDASGRWGHVLADSVVVVRPAPPDR